MENRGFGWLIKYDVVYWNDSKSMERRKGSDTHVRAFISIPGALKLFQLSTFKLSLHLLSATETTRWRESMNIFHIWSINIQ